MKLPRPSSYANLLEGVTQLADTVERVLNGSDRGLALLKLLVPGDHKVAFGSNILTWPGGTQGSNPGTIPHGLGKAPLFYCWTIVGGGNPDFVYAHTPEDATNIYPVGWNALGIQGAGNKTLFWLAIA